MLARDVLALCVAALACFVAARAREGVTFAPSARFDDGFGARRGAGRDERGTRDRGRRAGDVADARVRRGRADSRGRDARGAGGRAWAKTYG
jgi:hypothetical protein